MAMVHEAVDEGRGHDFVSEDVAPFLERLVRGEHCGAVLVPTRHQLEEEHRTCGTDRQIADFVDHQQSRVRECLQPVREPPSSLGLLERADQVDLTP
jgi:hypothetical protein